MYLKHKLYEYKILIKMQCSKKKNMEFYFLIFMNSHTKIFYKVEWSRENIILKFLNFHILFSRIKNVIK